MRGEPYTHPHGAGLTDAGRVVAHATAVFAIAAGVVHISAAADHENLPVMLAGFLVVATLLLALGGLLLLGVRSLPGDAPARPQRSSRRDHGMP